MRVSPSFVSSSSIALVVLACVCGCAEIQRAMPPTLRSKLGVLTGANLKPVSVTSSVGDTGYAGYSEDFQPLKEDLLKGRMDAAKNRITARYGDTSDREAYVDRAGLLGLLEAGSLRMLWGDSQGSIDDLRSVETILEDRAGDSMLEEGSEEAGLFLLEGVLGNEEIGGYAGEGYEKILMLNFASMAYLIEGDEKAYNVTRRAIDWQNVAWKAFQAEKAELQKELAEAKADGKSAVDSKSLSDIERTLDGYYEKRDKQGKQIVKAADAYLNPFGYYLAGVVQELKSSIEPSLVDNAAISYKKSLELNPGSDVLKRAVKEVETSGGKRTVHVVVGEGLAPETKVMTLNVSGLGQTVPVKIPVSEPVPSSITKIEVRDGKGKSLGTMSRVSDIEAIVLQHHRDMRPQQTVRVIVQVVRSFIQNEFWRRLNDRISGAGRYIEKEYNELLEANPDTRSWMSLPARMHAVRFTAPSGLRDIQIISYGKGGKRLSAHKVQLAPSGSAFVYGRAIESSLVAVASKELWKAP